MGTDTIRKIICNASTSEQVDGQLLHAFEATLPQLSQVLLLPEKNPAPALVDFIQRYIAYVPDFIDQLAEAARHGGVAPYVAPFLAIAEDYFLAPPEAVIGQAPLMALMDEAFLAHRLMEEVNDRYIRHRQVALIPIDMTQANVIVHHIIGDGLANQLDTLVQHTVSRLVDQEHLFEEAGYQLYSPMDLGGLAADLQCLSGSAEIQLRLGR